MIDLSRGGRYYFFTNDNFYALYIRKLGHLDFTKFITGNK
ncbi:hypothetical protein ABIB40_002715 [Pedobacter sp. UYP30]